LAVGGIFGTSGNQAAESSPLFSTTRFQRTTSNSNYVHNVLVLLTAVAVGCSSSGAVSVEGTITLDGEPLSGAQVLFESTTVGEAGAATAMYFGTTDASGRYVLKATGENDSGAPTGEYRVKISTAVATGEATELTPIPPERVPMQFRDGSQSFIVPDGGTTSADFALQSQ
jgi:hypothetical protein